MKIKDIMSKSVEVLSPNTPLNQVALKMSYRDCGCILIAENDRLVGVITDRDLVIRCMSEGHNPINTKAKSIMTKKILYCRESDDIAETSFNMTRNKIRRLPVLDKNKRLVGIISLGDLAAHSTDHAICGKALGHICAGPKQNIKEKSDA